MNRHRAATHRVWDPNKEATMNNEVLRRNEHMKRKLFHDVRGYAHAFVINNAPCLEPWGEWIPIPTYERQQCLKHKHGAPIGPVYICHAVVLSIAWKSSMMSSLTSPTMGRRFQSIIVCHCGCRLKRPYDQTTVQTSVRHNVFVVTCFVCLAPKSNMFNCGSADWYTRNSLLQRAVGGKSGKHFVYIYDSIVLLDM